MNLLVDLDQLRGSLEKLVDSNRLIFLDTNFFFPHFYSDGGERHELWEVLSELDNPHLGLDIDEIRDAIDYLLPYHRAYLGVMVNFLSKHDGVFTIDEVRTELKNSKRFFDRKYKRWKRIRRNHSRDRSVEKGWKGMRSHFSLLLQFLEAYDRKVFNRVYLDEKSSSIYQEILSIVGSKGDLPRHVLKHTPYLYTDEKLVSGAYFNVLRLSDMVDSAIVSEDPHIVGLLENSKSDIAFRISALYEHLYNRKPNHKNIFRIGAYRCNPRSREFGITRLIAN